MAYRKIENVSPEEIAKFHARTLPMESGCIEWRGTRSKGYGLFRFRGKQLLAHRVALAAATGLSGEKLDALHSCDNPSCVNPAHLRWGTRDDNMKDAKDRSRFAKGEKHGVSKLTADQVRAIRLSDEPAYIWAERLGVTLSAVTMARSGKRWSHIETPAIPARSGQARGERQGSSRLNEALVKEIRNSPLRGQAAVAAFNVSAVTIGLIRKRKAWAHVP